MGLSEDPEIQRRSIAMLPPQSPALDREAAMMLIDKLQAAHHRILELEHLTRNASLQRHPAAKAKPESS